MIWLGGLFIPLPKFLEAQEAIWPVFHLKQLAMNITGARGLQLVSPWLSIGVMVALTVLFGGLAIRRLARKG
jgi:hypothetical protein